MNGLVFWGLKTKSNGTSLVFFHATAHLTGPCSTTTHLDAMFGATHIGAAEPQFKKMFFLLLFTSPNGEWVVATQRFFIFIPTWGNDFILTNMFQMR